MNDSDNINLFSNFDYVLETFIKFIFGVDNNLVIKIAKLSVWIETFVFATPLSFIEHHIKQGNSLISTTIKNF
ncbi:hypothetical protein ABSA28_00610 [Candidatus Hepatincolaceae symbiont of Richtersius coronifer]